MRFHGQKRHAHAILAFGWQCESQCRAFARKKLVRNLDQDARAIARFGIAAAGAAMRQVHEHLNSFEDDVVGFTAFDAGHEADPAGIVFMARVVETLGSGETGDTPGFGHVISVEALSVTGPSVLCNKDLIIMQYKYAL